MTDTLASRSGPLITYTLDAFPEPPPTLEAARAHANAQPLADIDVANPKLFHADLVGPYFERLRREDPVHYVESPTFGGHWSITRYNDIMSVDMNHAQFSSDAGLGGITINDISNGRLPMFIA